MPQFVLELYVSRSDSAAVDRGAERARRAAKQLRGQGTQVRYLRSMFVPGDETCFHLFEAGSIGAVREAAARAEIEFERVTEAISDGTGPRSCQQRTKEK